MVKIVVREEFATLLYPIETVLNSRPMFTTGDDDVEVLNPALQILWPCENFRLQ